GRTGGGADDSTEIEPQIPWRRAQPARSPPPLVGPAPVPRPEPRRSFTTQLVLLAGVSILSGLAVAAYFKFGNELSPSVAPQLASTSTRPVQTVTVTAPAPPATPADRSDNAAPAPVMTAAAVPPAVPLAPLARPTLPPA